MKKAKIGLIGCGARGRSVHLPAIIEGQKGGLLELVAVCDAVEGVSRETGEAYHVPYYTSAEKMLEKEKEIDIVYITTNDYQHHVYGKLAAENGKHVFVEKPMAVTLPCCDVIIKACEKAGVYYEVGEQYFRCPTDRTVMKIVQNQQIGNVVRAHVKDPEPVHRSDSGVCMDMGVHCMSEIRTYIGGEPTKVTGLVKKLMPQQAAGVLQEDWGFAFVEFEKGQVGTCECATTVWDDPDKDCYRQVVGTDGIIQVDARTSVIEGILSLRKRVNEKFVEVPVKKNYGSLLKGHKGLESIVVKTSPEIVWKNPYTGYNLTDSRIGVMDEIMSITNAALNDKPPEYGVNARKDVEMCVAWYESSLRGEPIKLPITSLTSYEKMVHEDFKKRFGRNPTDI
jgi:predicted dehydrogenase